jgi:hypothetical protein
VLKKILDKIEKFVGDAFRELSKKGNACWGTLIRPPAPIYNKKKIFFIKTRLTGDG